MLQTVCVEEFTYDRSQGVDDQVWNSGSCPETVFRYLHREFVLILQLSIIISPIGLSSNTSISYMVITGHKMCGFFSVLIFMGKKFLRRKSFIFTTVCYNGLLV